MAFTARTETYARGSSLTTPFNFTINKATGVVDGDIMFMFLMVYIATPPTIDSVPEGWTLVATNATSNSRWYLYYKIASSEGASYTWSLTASCRYYALNIAYSSGDFDVSSIDDITAISNTLYGTAGATVRAASMNVPDANSPLVYFGAIYNTTVRTFTPPTTPVDAWVEDADQGHTTPDISMTNGSMIWTGSGNTGDMDITCSTSITTEKHAFAVALKPVSEPEVIEGIGAGSGIGLATCSALLNVLAQGDGAGIGLASSLSLLNVLAQVQASGIGLASASGDAFPPFEIIEGLASGSGIGTSQSTSSVIVIINVGASGIGLSDSVAYLIIPINASGESVGLGGGNAYLVIPASVSGSGVGLSEALAYLETTGQAYGEGIGLGSATGEIITGVVEGLASGSGLGFGSIEALVRILASISASGEGLGQAEALLEIISEAVGQGIGLAIANGEIAGAVIIEGQSQGSGIGLATAIIMKRLLAPAGKDIKVYEPLTSGDIWY